ncbi:MAG: hypothetical protein O2925_07410 [Actinomycetota bacterium]|nr:hypothetical protein [Actinomycetota bacterium]MDA3015702.1 hypothetical protein [Actinomycetota bacterium]MDA3028614.1 hypothetical protein [Actinomycetota bacterium]
MNGRWDVAALRAGGSVSLVFAVPFSIAASWAGDRGSSTLAIWLVLGAIGGFGLGAGCGAWVQRVGMPLTHGLVSATGTYLAAQAVFVTIKVVTGGSVGWFGILFNLSVVSLVGILGGMLGRRLRNRGVLPSTERVGL